MATKRRMPNIRKTCERIVNEEIWKEAAKNDVEGIIRVMKKKTGTRQMTLNQLLRIVDGAYPDGFTAEYWDPKAQEINEGASGDTLAEFIVRELQGCVCATTEDTLEEALRLMNKAVEDISGVRDAIEEHLNALIMKKRSQRKGRHGRAVQ